MFAQNDPNITRQPQRHDLELQVLTEGTNEALLAIDVGTIHPWCRTTHRHNSWLEGVGSTGCFRTLASPLPVRLESSRAAYARQRFSGTTTKTWRPAKLLWRLSKPVQWAQRTLLPHATLGKYYVECPGNAVNACQQYF